MIYWSTCTITWQLWLRQTVSLWFSVYFGPEEIKLWFRLHAHESLACHGSYLQENDVTWCSAARAALSLSVHGTWLKWWESVGFFGEAYNQVYMFYQSNCAIVGLTLAPSPSPQVWQCMQISQLYFLENLGLAQKLVRIWLCQPYRFWRPCTMKSGCVMLCNCACVCDWLK